MSATSNGQERARRLYPTLGDCEECGDPAHDRHHKDGDTSNNDRANVAFLCRRCHMEADGRLEVFRAFDYKKGGRPRKPLAPCKNCGRLYKPLRHGRCNHCETHWRKYGDEMDITKIKVTVLVAERQP